MRIVNLNESWGPLSPPGTMFLQQNNCLPERKKSSCRKLYPFNVQNATIVTRFIATAKINTVTRNINAVNASASLRQTVWKPIKYENILVVLVVVNRHFFITTTNIIPTIVVVIKNAITLCSYLNQLVYLVLLCPSWLVKQILKGWDTRYKRSSQH